MPQRLDGLVCLVELVERDRVQSKAGDGALVPGLDSRAVEVLVLYAQSSAKYLAGIKAVVDRAAYCARKEGRSGIQLADVKRAIKESVIPSDSAFSAAMQANEKPMRRRAVSLPATVPAEPLQADFNRSERPLQAPELMRARSHLVDAGAELVH